MAMYDRLPSLLQSFQMNEASLDIRLINDYRKVGRAARQAQATAEPAPPIVLTLPVETAGPDGVAVTREAQRKWRIADPAPSVGAIPAVCLVLAHGTLQDFELDCRNFRSDAQIAAFAACMPKQLHRLRLNFEYARWKLGDAGLAALAAALPPQLRELELRLGQGEGQLGDTGLVALALALPPLLQQLRLVDLCTCRRLGERSLAALAAGVPWQLSEFDVDHPKLEGKSLKELRHWAAEHGEAIGALECLRRAVEHASSLQGPSHTGPGFSIVQDEDYRCSNYRLREPIANLEIAKGSAPTVRWNMDHPRISDVDRIAVLRKFEATREVQHSFEDLAKPADPVSFDLDDWSGPGDPLCGSPVSVCLWSRLDPALGGEQAGGGSPVSDRVGVWGPQ